MGRVRGFIDHLIHFWLVVLNVPYIVIGNVFSTSVKNAGGLAICFYLTKNNIVHTCAHFILKGDLL